jgi:glycosyltransferase involved in cell wall biosynthesis
MPSISILVPIYNVELFLNECLNSIKSQTFKDFEVICINDGSTDGSLNIINEFIKKDKRFKLINKKNTGYGHSMNEGLSCCRGKYVGIVESDDYIENNMFERLYTAAEKYALDTVRCNYYKFTKNQRTPENLNYIEPNKVIRPIDFPEFLYQAPSIWANLYRKDFLEKNNIIFLETPGASYQDVSFAFKVYVLSQRLMFINEPLLNYRVDNINSSINSDEKVYCVCVEYREILNFLKANPEIYNKIQFHLPLLRYNCYKWNYMRIAKKFKLSFLKEWQKDIRDDFKAKRIDKKIINCKQLINMFIIRYFPLILAWSKRK